MQTKFETLLSPIQIGSLRLAHRMVRSPMWTRTCSTDGEVTQQQLDYYENAAKGGPSMIIVEAIAVAERYSWPESQLRIDDIRYMAGLKRLVETIHLNNVPCELQIHCAGAFGRDPISPSGVACYGLGRAWYVQPRVLTLPEIEEIRDRFITAAVRTKELESDGVVIHGAASYLLQQWVSPHTNKRTDRYGGDFENRIQLPLEIIRGIRQKCGPSFPIGYSMVIDELNADGITLEESVRFTKTLEQEGVNHVDLLLGTYETGSLEKGVGRSPRQPKGLFDQAAIIKKNVSNIKVFTRCFGEHNPVKWEEALRNGQCDVIQIGRPLLCDPELPKKVIAGNIDDIRFCIRCAQCLDAGVVRSFQHHCSLNAELAKERDYAVKQITSGRKRVLVIGGGPAGLEASRVAALRGHEVILMEKATQLGGYARIAAIPIGKEDIKTYFIDWIERQCRKVGVKLELNKEVSLETVKELRPDAVIVATGAKPLIPPVPGIDKSHVVIAEDVLTGKTRVGKRVVVAGGGEVGVETADFIAEKNMAESVTIIEMLPAIALDMPAMPRTYMLQVILPKWGIKLFTSMRIYEITDKAVMTLDKNWNVNKFDADTVVNAMGYIPNNTLGEALKAVVPEVYMIGDCVKPRNILHAVHDAAYVARKI